MSKEIENQELINKLRSLVGDELIDQLLDYDNYTAKDQRLNKTEVCRKVGYSIMVLKTKLKRIKDYLQKQSI